MKKLLSVCLLIFALSFPAFAGHTQAGGFGWCECTPVQGVCSCCGGSFLTVANDQENNSISQHVLDGTGPIQTFRVRAACGH